MELPSILRGHWANAVNISDTSLEYAREELQLLPLAPPWLQFLHYKIFSCDLLEIFDFCLLQVRVY